jgi:hypothetical protein
MRRKSEGMASQPSQPVSQERRSSDFSMLSKIDPRVRDKIYSILSYPPSFLLSILFILLPPLYLIHPSILFSFLHPQYLPAK